MGVHLSTTASLSPLSLASVIIGLISFAFTLGTFFRVFWQNITTIFVASTEVPETLTTLRQELYEERRSLRSLRRHQRVRNVEGKSRDVFAGPELDEAVIRTLMATVRHLTRKFKELERPFLARSERERRLGRRRRRSRRRRNSLTGDSEVDVDDAVVYAASRVDWGDEKDAERGDRERDAAYDEEREYSRGIYCNMTVGKRLAWLRYRGEAVSLLESLARVQTRRIARQVGEIAVVLHEYGDVFEEMRHNLSVTQERMSRVVGVRRVD